MGRSVVEYEEEYSIKHAFGDWLRERRIRKGFSLSYAASLAEMSVNRLKALEEGATEQGLSGEEVHHISRVYGLDPRATIRRSQTG